MVDWLRNLGSWDNALIVWVGIVVFIKVSKIHGRTRADLLNSSISMKEEKRGLITIDVML